MIHHRGYIQTLLKVFSWNYKNIKCKKHIIISKIKPVTKIFVVIKSSIQQQNNNNLKSHFYFYIFSSSQKQDREFVEMDLPFSGVTKSLGGPQPSAGSRPPSPSHSDSNAIVSNIFSNCCGKSNCCKKVCMYDIYIFIQEQVLLKYIYTSWPTSITYT